MKLLIEFCPIKRRFDALVPKARVVFIHFLNILGNNFQTIFFAAATGAMAAKDFPLDVQQ